MRKIHDSNAVFNVSINPFINKIVVIHLNTMEKYSWQYESINYRGWFHGFGVGNVSYKIRVTYNNGLIVNVVSGDVDVPFNLDIDGI